MAEHPAHGLAATVSNAAEELGSYMRDDSLWPLTDADYEQILPRLAGAAGKLAECVMRIAWATATAGEARKTLETAAWDIARSAGDMLDAVPAIGDAARQAPAAEAARHARAVETAWNLGTEHGRAASTAFSGYIKPPGRHNLRTITSDSAEAAAVLAEALALPGGGRDRDASEALHAYCEALDEASGSDDYLVAGQYMAGQQVVTALGRMGVLTGESGRTGHPRVRFADGTDAVVHRWAITCPVVRVFSSSREAQDAYREVADDRLAAGDVLSVHDHSGGTARVAVVSEGGLVMPSDELAGVDDGRYADSVRIARELITQAAAARPAAELQAGG